MTSKARNILQTDLDQVKVNLSLNCRIELQRNGAIFFSVVEIFK